MSRAVDYNSPSAQFTYDVSNSTFYRKDARNYINVLSIDKLNTLGNSSLLDIYLSRGNVVEPHIHQNASELVYCISGTALVSLLNPFTKELKQYSITPGQVANVPQAWWHYEEAMADNTHLLAIFDAPAPEVIFGSDILRLTPASAFAHTYCLDEAKVKDTFAPITQTVVIGPPTDCGKPQTQVESAKINKPLPNQAYPDTAYPNSGTPNRDYGNRVIPNGAYAYQGYGSYVHQAHVSQPVPIPPYWGC